MRLTHQGGKAGLGAAWIGRARSGDAWRGKGRNNPRRHTMAEQTAWKAKPNNTMGVNDEQATVIGKELERLQAKHGGLTTREIVDEAKSPKSPLHPFIWDKSDAEVAYKYRLHLARELRRSVCVFVVNDRDEEVSVPATLALKVVDAQAAPKGTAQQTAETLPVIKSRTDIDHNPALQAVAARTVFGRVAAYRNQLSQYPRFAKLVDEIDRIAAQYEKEDKQRRVDTAKAMPAATV